MRAEPGDLIEFNRGTFSHWAMYAGNGEVYNICAESKHESQTKIKLQSLKSVCELNHSYQLVRINNLTRHAQSRNLTPRSTTDCLKAASVMNGRKVPYNILNTNCEYYCTLWKYGTGFSVQAHNAREIGQSLYDWAIGN